ncbi:clustered mitochondria protein homolog isoform X1 [Pygocentrus nattereri]|uniref:Clustered mitochondria protein homolog n=2 Tax=Pygocentrus nattereri TaxID=42514 RepID=A0A3B4CDN8_PYGNA|nr:clustered mitochondria protein homolog isoform X1 [Pygocentrus nattereri]XP_017559849.1 clustered mitochondria protein homolog isoform X1 [Pygocentrus nattereri]
MGNILKCCYQVSHFIWGQDVPGQTEEQSPLLSRQNSDVESLSPSKTSASTSDVLPFPVLDQDHLLYPDIVLSSNLRAVLDREDLAQPLELVLAERGQKHGRNDGIDQTHEGFGGEDDAVRMSNTSISQQELQYLDRNQLCATEKEWPLLSSLYSQQWPTEQPTAVNSTSQTLIYTHGQETRIWSNSICQDVQLLAQGNTSQQLTSSEPQSGHSPLLEKLVKDATQTDFDNFDTVKARVGGAHIEPKEQDASELAKGFAPEQMEQNLVQWGMNLAQLGPEVIQTAGHLLLNAGESKNRVVCSDTNVAQIDECVVALDLEGIQQVEHYPIQTEQGEAHHRETIAQPDGDEDHDPLSAKDPVLNLLQAKQRVEKNQQETLQTEQVKLEQESERNLTQMVKAVGQTLVHIEQHTAENGQEVLPKEQDRMELRAVLEEQHNQRSERQRKDEAEADQNMDQTKEVVVQIQQEENTFGRQQDPEQTAMVIDQGTDKEETDRFTLFVVDKLFLATPNITGPSTDNAFSGQAELSELDRYRAKEHQDDPAALEDTPEDTGFTVKIQAPGSEPTDFQVSPLAMVQEIKQVLMDREETCHRTCFSLQLDGNTLDNFAHLRSVAGLQEGSLLRIVEDSYTIREVRIHLRHIRDLLKSLDPTDAYNGVEGSSLSFLRFFTEEHTEDSGKVKKKGEELKHFSCSPPEYILPGTKECFLAPLQPQTEKLKPTECLKVLATSSWNPPPGNRKMHGDLMYLNVVTMEDRHCSVTASTRGFYINQSTTYSFNPKPASPSVLSHSLVELLSQISPVFKKNFIALLKKRTSTHPFERIATPFQVFGWTAPALDHAMDCVRAEDTSSSHLGYEDHVPGQIRDWNEELQSTRELPRKTLTDRLLRDRAIFKANSDFVTTATRGAMAVIDGNVMPINPSEDPRNQMFIWNSIFFSLGFDVREHYQDLGGEAAAHAASTIDLNGVRAYSLVDADGLYVLGTVVVDYRGFRVTAQSIVPGILERGQEQSVVYGSIDFGKTVNSNEKYLKLLDKPSKQLRVQRHLVLNKDDTAVELCSSVECKGIVGNDGRHYILDLLFTFPLDLNFLPLEGEELKPECQQLGFPRQHPHRLACLRQELIEAFVKHRYHLVMEAVSEDVEQEDNCIKAAASPLVNHSPNASPNSSSQDIGGTLDTAIQNTSPRESIPSSFRNSSFDIRFNPNIFSPGVRFPKESCKDIQEQKQLLKDAAAFLISSQIPALIRSCLDHTTMPMDGVTLTEALHQNGINVRYLGTVLECIEKNSQKHRLDHVYRIALCELITRCTKHLFRTYLLAVEPSALSASVSHFLNCFLSSSPDLPGTQQMDRLASRRRSRRRRSRGSVGGAVTAWASLTTSELWRTVQAEALEYYHYCLPCESVEQAVDKCGLQRITLLREISIKTGIQILIREYHFDAKHKPVFTEEDVLNIFPIVKHISPRASDGLYLLHCGQAKVQQGCLKEGCELISQALGLFTNVYGALHRDVCTCLRLLGRIYYILGDYSEALSHQQRAVLISERVLGIEHPNTIQEYKHLGLYCFAGGQAATALRLLYRARYLMLVVCGEDHPEMALLDSKIGLVLHGVMECDLALRFLESALALTSKYQGPGSLKVAQSHHLLAKVYESKGDFRSALRHEKERYMIYRNQVGEAHEKTRESSEYLKHLTNQAVILQRTMNMIYKNSSGANITPLKLTAPSRLWIVEQLNLVTGIVLIPLSNKDLETLRVNPQKTAA